MNEVEQYALQYINDIMQGGIMNMILLSEEDLIDKYACDISDLSQDEDSNFVMSIPVITNKAMNWQLIHLVNINVFGDMCEIKRKLNKPGIYVIKNITKDKCYVGQSVRVYDRMESHFSQSGSDNGIYEDMYENGDIFAVNFIYCDKSELNDMETRYIKKYDCVEHGYNKNYGYGKNE